MMYGLLAKATITITDQHMMIGGAVLIGIFAILGIRKWVKMSASKRQQVFDALLQEVTDRVHGAVGAHNIPTQGIENLLSQKFDSFATSTQRMIKDDIDSLKGAHRRFTDDMATRMATSIMEKAGVALNPPPANDPGFTKPCALPSKIGDLDELRRRVGRAKVDHMLREAGLSTNATFDEVKQSLKWGTYGPNGDRPLTPIRFIECDTNHLENIVATQAHLNLLHYHVILAILRDRYLAGGASAKSYARPGFPDIDKDFGRISDGPFSA